MVSMNSPEHRPVDLYVQAALFCNEVESYKDNAVTFIGVHNQVLVTYNLPDAPSHMPKVEHDLIMVLGFSSDTLRGTHTVTVRMIHPEGHRSEELESFDFELPESELMTPVRVPRHVTFETEGTYWFEVRYQGELLTRIPLQVNYRRAFS